MALPDHEWLHLAQRLAVGQSSRAYHKNEATPAMTIRNLPDRWTAYCHRCHQAAVKLKTHAVLSRVPDQKRFMPWPADAKPLEEWPLYEQETIFKLLLEKGIDRQVHLAPVPVWYSRDQGRLILGTSLGWIGRATRGQLPKWTGYGYPAPAYAAAPGALAPGAPVVLTEDYLSALKLHWAMRGGGIPGTGAACLGTTAGDKLVLDLVQSRPDWVAVAFDGDRAGRVQVGPVLKRLRGVGLNAFALNTPSGYDPKDLTQEQLIQLIGEGVGTPIASSPHAPG